MLITRGIAIFLERPLLSFRGFYLFWNPVIPTWPSIAYGPSHRVSNDNDDDIGFCRFRVVDGFFHNTQGRLFREFRHDFHVRPKCTRTARAPSRVQSQYYYPNIINIHVIFSSPFHIKYIFSLLDINATVAVAAG